MSFAPKKILVPVDVAPIADRPLADRLVDDAVSFARAHDAGVTLLFVGAPMVSAPLVPEVQDGAAHRAMLDVMEARNSASSRALQALVERAQAAGVNARSLVTMRAGGVPHVIVDVGAEEACDLIVMTTHGRRGVRRLLLGSVAERVAHLAAIPVLLLPPAT